MHQPEGAKVGVVTYVRKALGIKVMTQPDIVNHPGVLVIDMEYGSRPFQLVNVYNPKGNSGDVLQIESEGLA
jgi:hypothetical protein